MIQIEMYEAKHSGRFAIVQSCCFAQDQNVVRISNPFGIQTL